jgi:hypothetical protein
MIIDFGTPEEVSSFFSPLFKCVLFFLLRAMVRLLFRKKYLLISLILKQDQYLSQKLNPNNTILSYLLFATPIPPENEWPTRIFSWTFNA